MKPRDSSTCGVLVPEPPGYWHQHRCGRPARVIVREKNSAFTKALCGIHARQWERHGWIRANG